MPVTTLKQTTMPVTREYIKAMLPVFQAFAEGKTIEQQGCVGWYPVEQLTLDLPPRNFRVKKEPVLVELGPEDVPPGSVIRNGGCAMWVLITHVGSEGVGVEVPNGPDQIPIRISWDELADSHEIKRPGEDWQPCKKKVPAP